MPSSRRVNRKKKSVIGEWVKAIIFAVTLATLVRWAIIEGFSVPSSSMEKTLLPGDYIFVSKLHYGARIPVTPLQIPLTHKSIGNMQSYLDWIQLPLCRLPGVSKIKRGDVIVFNYPMELDKPLDMREYYVKRCIGLPGDLLYIENSKVYISNELLEDYPNVQHRYFIKTNSPLTDVFLTYNITEAIPVREGYLVHSTSHNIELLKKILSVDEVHQIIMPKNVMDPQIFVSCDILPWNEDNFGPIAVPYKGMVVKIDEKSLVQYERTIVYHEGNNNVEISEDKLFIDGKLVESYTFKQNYYFMMGDNRSNSKDSRYWGFVPEDHIFGKAVSLFHLIQIKDSYTRLGMIEFVKALNRLIGTSVDFKT